VVLANLSEEDYKRKKNKWLPKIKLWLDQHAVRRAASSILHPARWAPACGSARGALACV